MSGVHMMDKRSSRRNQVFKARSATLQGFSRNVTSGFDSYCSCGTDSKQMETIDATIIRMEKNAKIFAGFDVSGSLMMFHIRVRNDRSTASLSSFAGSWCKNMIQQSI